MNLESEKKRALSNRDVMKLVKHKANVVGYPDLVNYKTLDELLGPHRAAFILYEWEPDFGHWISIFRRGNSVEFFDPFGLKPDEHIKTMPKNQRVYTQQEYPYLTKLLIDSPYDISYNHHKLQNKNANTCGRWAALRLIFKDFTLEQFNKLMSPPSEDLVTILTMFQLRDSLSLWIPPRKRNRI